LPNGYYEFLGYLKEKIRTAQIKAVISVNRELILLYWEIGMDILTRQRKERWGTKVIERLALDLKNEFPNMNGFSVRNLKYMRAFAEANPKKTIVQQLAAQIPWFHNCVLMDKVKDPTERIWYAQKTVENGWSRAVLVHQIKSGLYHRQGKAVTNFDESLPPARSDLVKQALKAPYVFDFLTIDESASERELEASLVEHIRKFLLELGVGFAFVGSQYHFEVEGDDFYIDLLFYHLGLRCFVAIDLKTAEFKPEYAGKMNFYLAVVDDILKHPSDNPSIGIILCKDKKKRVAQYALRNNRTPIGISEYRLTGTLPKELEGYLPAISELEHELDRFQVNVRKRKDGGRKEHGVG